MVVVVSGGSDVSGVVVVQSLHTKSFRKHPPVDPKARPQPTIADSHNTLGNSILGFSQTLT